MENSSQHQIWKTVKVDVHFYTTISHWKSSLIRKVSDTAVSTITKKEPPVVTVMFNSNCEKQDL